MNEAILLVTALIDLCAVYVAGMFGRVWIYMTIIVNLRLITLLGAKLIPSFGHVTNAGNIFYVAVFFAMLLLLEHGTARDARRGVLIGVISGILLFIFATAMLYTTSAPATANLSDLMRQVLSVTPRLGIASLSAFVLAQSLVILIYMQWSANFGTNRWWLRVVGAILAGELVDSVIFFSVAFYGTVPTTETLAIMFAGYVVKVALGLCALPLLYLSHAMKPAASPSRI